MTASWDALAGELDAWGAAGRTATFWWRDDDATAPSPELDALLDTAASAPVALAVVPHGASEDLPGRLAGAPNVTVLQHGYAHANHAPEGEKKVELGPHRRADHVIAELATGQDRLDRLFGDRFLPVLVPPWNRIAPYLVPMLPEMRYRGLSTFAPRRRAQPVAGFPQVNAHVDLIDWRGSRAFVGAEPALAAAIQHLSDRREGRADPEEATGILTHHLVQNADSWAFTGRLLASIDAHPAAELCAAGDLFRSNP